MIKALETHYRGYKFRSRLEARWAVYFDALGLEWEYEKEGFDIDGKWYLPDFFLPLFKICAEVKPTIFTEKEYSLIAALRGLVLDGMPEHKFYTIAGSQCAICKVPYENSACACYQCYLAGEKFFAVNFEWSIHKGRLWHSFGEDIGCYANQEQPAIAAARSARFESGFTQERL